MKTGLKFRNIGFISVLLLGLVLIPPTCSVEADGTAQSLPFSQDWTDTSLIIADADWSGVPGILGYKGDFFPDDAPTGLDPQTILTDTTTIHLLPNQTSVAITSSGVAEFEIDDPTIALQASNVADAPYLLINLDTTGKYNVSVTYDIRDIDTTEDNAIQKVALHYRVGNTGEWTNLPGGYIGDATTGPSLASLVTHVSVTLPDGTDNQPLVQVRIMTTNAAGVDEWIGIDNLLISEPVADAAPFVMTTFPANNATDVVWNSNLSVTFSEAVDVSVEWFSISCVNSGIHTAIVSGGPTTYILDPVVDFTPSEICTVTILAAQVSDQDTEDPPANMAADYSWSFTMEPEYPIWLPLILR